MLKPYVGYGYSYLDQSHENRAGVGEVPQRDRALAFGSNLRLGVLPTIRADGRCRAKCKPGFADVEYDTELRLTTPL
jgi:hypothetical protein